MRRSSHRGFRPLPPRAMTIQLRRRFARMRLLALVLALMSIAADLSAQVSKQSFGKTPDGTPVDIYTLKSGAIEARIITYGGIVQSLKVPDKNGKIADVVLGFDSIDGYAGG